MKRMYCDGCNTECEIELRPLAGVRPPKHPGAQIIVSVSKCCGLGATEGPRLNYKSWDERVEMAGEFWEAREPLTDEVAATRAYVAKHYPSV